MKRTDARLKFYRTDHDSEEFCIMWSSPGYLIDSLQTAQSVLEAAVPGWYPSAVNLYLGNGKRHSGRVVLLSTVANRELAEKEEIVCIFQKIFGEIEVSDGWR